MKKRKIQVRFEPDDTLEHIEVLVRAPERDKEVEAVIARVSARPPNPLVITDEDGALRRIDPAEIVLVSVNGKRVDVLTETARYMTRQSLQSVESSLDSTQFLRISRYELVNLSKIIRYDFTLAGTLRMELAGGMEVWASRRCIPAIRERLNRGEDGACS